MSLCKGKGMNHLASSYHHRHQSWIRYAPVGIKVVEANLHYRKVEAKLQRGVSSRGKEWISAPKSYYSSITLAPFSPFKRIVEAPPAQQAFLLLGLMACLTTGALFALIATAIPMLNAMRRAAISLEKLADVAREELPGTMAAIRLSGMEISDLTLELSDLSQEISEGVRSSTRVVQAAEIGIRRVGAAAASQTFSMLQEHASVPVEAVKPVVASAAESTWQALTQAQRSVLGLASLPILSRWIQRRKLEQNKGKQQNPEGMNEPSAFIDEEEVEESSTGVYK